MHEAGNQIVDASFTRQRVFEIKTFSSLYLSFMSNEILAASMKQVFFSIQRQFEHESSAQTFLCVLTRCMED